MKKLLIMPLVAVALSFGNSAVLADGAKGGAQDLLPKRAVTVTHGAAPAHMACPKCQYKTTQVRETERGQIRVRDVQRMECPGCSTKLETVGHGKMKQEISRHTCDNCGAHTKNCCAKM